MMQSNSRIYAELRGGRFNQRDIQCDHFDRIPDSVVLLIFNKVTDIRSLGRCAVVAKRFSELVPLVNDVCLKIDRVDTGDLDSEESLSLYSVKPRSLLYHLLRLMLYTIFKPFQQIQNTNCGNKPFLPQLSQHSPSQVLKNFKDIRNLRIELPTGDVGTDDGVLLRWRAEFGSTLQNCVILGGTRTDHKPNPTDQEGSGGDDGSIPESFYMNGGLKLRVVWTISSLIAASTRHFLLRPIIKDHPTLRSLVLTDADDQGTLYMGVDQLKEFREKPLTASASTNRTQVPASNMKLRYAPYLELPEGIGLQGATLVSIKPAGDGNSCTNHIRKEADTFVSAAFGRRFDAVVKALVKRRTYLLEMNGF